MTECVSVIVATYNAALGLQRSLDSIASQEGYDPSRVEFILIDGKSTDDTVALARASGLFHAIVSEADRGVYDAMNKGAEMASHGWLHFLNAGDLFAGKYGLKSILETAEEARAGSRLWFVARARNVASGGAVIRNIPHRWLPHALGIQPHCHQSTFFDATFFRSIGGYSLDFGTAGDFDLILRVGMAGRPLESDAIVVLYEGGGISDNGARENARVQRAVRLERMQVEGRLRYAEWGASRAVLIMNWGRIAVGRLRRRLRGGGGCGTWLRVRARPRAF